MITETRILASIAAWALLIVVGLLLLVVVMRRNDVQWTSVVLMLIAFLAVSIASAMRSIIELEAIDELRFDDAALEAARWTIILGRALATLLALAALMHLTGRPRWMFRALRGLDR